MSVSAEAGRMSVSAADDAPTVTVLAAVTSDFLTDVPAATSSALQKLFMVVLYPRLLILTENGSFLTGTPRKRYILSFIDLSCLLNPADLEKWTMGRKVELIKVQ